MLERQIVELSSTIIIKLYYLSFDNHRINKQRVFLISFLFVIFDATDVIFDATEK